MTIPSNNQSPCRIVVSEPESSVLGRAQDVIGVHLLEGLRAVRGRTPSDERVLVVHGAEHQLVHDRLLAARVAQTDVRVLACFDAEVDFGHVDLGREELVVEARWCCSIV